MAQKRGLGRGLGALIPGGEATTSVSPDAEEQLRTRGSATDGDSAGDEDRPHRGSRGSTRPADMFFSGEPVEEPDRRERAPRQDIAGDMARDARRRRASRSAAGRSEPASSEPAPAEDAPAKGASAADEKGAKNSSPSRSAAAASKSSGTPTKRTKSSARGATGPSSSGSTKRAGTKKTSTNTTSTKTSGTSGTSASTKPEDQVPDSTPEVPTDTTPQSGPEEAADRHSPVVDVEPGETTPVREDETAAATGAEAGPADDTAGSEGLMPVPGAEFAEIPIQEIRENPRNPRTDFDDDELDELAHSLREVGMLQPVVVRPIPVTDAGESFELVMGERRWRAARRAGLASIPGIIRDTGDDELLRDALLENLHRSQLSPLEEAAAYQQLLEDFGCSQDELSDRIGRSRPQISNTLRLMRLPALVQRRLASGALSAGHARALLGLEDPHLMEELAQRIVSEGLSVRAVERLVSRGIAPTPSNTPRRSTYDPRVVDITSRLSNRLEAPVKIDVGKRKGKITLEFTNLDDLERVAERIGLELDRSAASERSAE